MSNKPAKNVFSISDVAKIFSVEAWKVRRLFERGLLPEPIRVGVARMICEEELPQIKKALDSAGYSSRDDDAEPEKPSRSSERKTEDVSIRNTIARFDDPGVRCIWRAAHVLSAHIDGKSLFDALNRELDSAFGVSISVSRPWGTSAESSSATELDQSRQEPTAPQQGGTSNAKT